MPHLYDLLKTDPYRTRPDDSVYISEEIFFKNVYAYPKKTLLDKLKNSMTHGSKSFRLFHINGYAGCGKTLFAHYIIHEFGNEQDFYYGFDQGEGKNYTLDLVITRIITCLSYEFTKSINTDKNVIKNFCELGREVFGLSAEYSIFEKLFYDSEVLNYYATNTIDEPTPVTLSRISDLFYEVTNVHLYNNITENDIIKFLLLCDYFFRCARYLANSSTSYDTIFCLLDNLDNLDRSTIVDLYLSINEVIESLSNIRLSDQTDKFKKLHHLKYIILFPTREVTSKKLRDGLRRKKKEELLSNQEIVFNFELQDNSASLETIIKNRIDFWQGKTLQDDINIMSVVNDIMRIPYIQGTFSSLFNGNYSMCVDRIIELYTSHPQLINECFSLQKDLNTSTDLLVCSRRGASGILLRVLLELFKSHDVYNDVTDIEEKSMFNVNGKLGLVELNLKTKGSMIGVSTSRIILTFLHESKDYKTKICNLFDCFPNIDGREICRYLYALCENTREVWRRLIVFNTNIPNSVEDLYRQYDMYKTSDEIDYSKYSEVELCLSGYTYISTVVPNFEFYLSRMLMEGGLSHYPALFSKKSLNDIADEKGYLYSIKAVTESVENCAQEIYKYDAMMIEKCCEANKHKYLKNLFVQSKANNSKYGIVKQSHLSRIIFSHISYIEHFRRYILSVIKEDKVEINKRIISYIIRYLALFDFEPFNSESYSCLMDNEYLPKNFLNPKTPQKNCKGIIELFNERVDRADEKTAYMLNLGFNNQRKAQLKLLELIVHIHKSEYKETGKIEL